MSGLPYPLEVLDKIKKNYNLVEYYNYRSMFR